MTPARSNLRYSTVGSHAFRLFPILLVGWMFVVPSCAQEDAAPPAAPKAQQSAEQPSTAQQPADQPSTGQQPPSQPSTGQQPTDKPLAEQAPTATPPANSVARLAKGPATPAREAWKLLSNGVQSDKTDQRAAAVRALALMRGETRAVKWSTTAIIDDKPKVRAAACEALGELRAVEAIPKLQEALDDTDISVVLAAAHALHTLKDPSADEAYYSILTGERKGTKGLVAGQLDILKDPKKMALMGFEEGIGFVPFGGIGYSAFKVIHSDDSAPVRAAAARMVAHDPDPVTEDALIRAAVGDKSAIVRGSALTALSERGNPKVIERITPAMSDSKDAVRYTAAAAILHLSAITPRKRKSHK